ncbi:MAG: heme-binding domain-containing protein [Bellilinea sp.]|nr:heme-binding domain-containing protein [Bellilinea sp.]
MTQKSSFRLPVAAFSILLLLLLGVFVLIQLLPIGKDQTNPPVIAEPNWDSPQTRQTFMQACGDCHSNETVWPWYSKIAPVSWLISRDVNEGRRKLNVSEWGVRENEADEAVKLVQNGEMPPWFYLPLHPQARLNSAQKQTFLNGLAATFGSENEINSQKIESEENDND